MLDSYIVVLITCPSKDEGLKIAKALLENKLAACINVIDGLDSYFWWKGKIDYAKEVLLIVKTRLDLFNKVVELVKKLHSYTVPEIIALPILAGNKDYLRWIDESLG